MNSRLAVCIIGYLCLSTFAASSSNSPHGNGAGDDSRFRLFLQACPKGCDCLDSNACGLKVDCSDMNRNEVPKGISPLTECLDLSLNNISRIAADSFEQLRQLKTLHLSGNKLRELPQNVFSSLKKLEILHLQDNLLTTIPANTVNRLPNLKDLNLGANFISSISSNAFAKLDKLEHLWLDANLLTEIPARAFKRTRAIKALNLGMNNIATVRNGDFDDLPLLKVLLLKHNFISRIENKAFAQSVNLQIIDLSNNNLSVLPPAIKSALNLHTLTLSGNRISSIPDFSFAGNSRLTELTLTLNPIKTVERTAFTGLKDLLALSLENVQELTEFPDLSGCTQLKSLTLSGGKLGGIPQEFCGHVPNLRALNLQRNRLSTISGLSACSNLTELDVSENEIAEVRAHDTKNLTKMRSLNLGLNKISRLDQDVFSNMNHVETLNLARNSFTFLPMRGLGNLRELNISGVHTMLYLPPVDLFHNLRSLAAYYPYHCCQVSKIRTKPINPGAMQRDFIIALGMAEHIPMTSPVQCSPNAGPMTPCEDLLPSTPMRVFWWAAVVLSFLLNCIIIVSCAVRYISRKRSVGSDEEMLGRIDPESPYTSNSRVVVHDSASLTPHYCLNIGRNGVTFYGSESFHATLCHLALADVCVTVYAAIVLGYDRTTRGVFAEDGAWWQQSAMCHSAGFLLTFGTQLAFGTVSVMAVERYLAVMHPLRAERRMRKTMLITSLASVWVISIATGIVTLYGGAEYGEEDAFLNTLPAKKGAACLPWTTEFVYMSIMVGVHALMCVVTCAVCASMLCRPKRSWLSPGKGSRTQATLTVAANIFLILPIALLAVIVSGHVTFSDLTPVYGGKYSGAGDGRVVFDMESILSFALFVIPLRPLLNPVLFLIFNKPLRRDIAYVAKHALFMNSTTRRTYAQSQILEPMFDSRTNSEVQTGNQTSFPDLNHVYRTERIIRPSLAYDNRGIASSSSVSYHAPSQSLGSNRCSEYQRSSRSNEYQRSNSERKRRKRYTRSQRAGRLAGDTDPTTESDVITFHRAAQAVYYDPDARERRRKKLSVRSGGVNAKDEFQRLVFPRENPRSSSDHVTESTIYPIMPSTISALAGTSCARRQGVSDSSKNLSCDADASELSSVEEFSARRCDSTLRPRYGVSEASSTIIPCSGGQNKLLADCETYDADREIAAITSSMTVICNGQTPDFGSCDNPNNSHCVPPRGNLDGVRPQLEESCAPALSGGEILNPDRRGYPLNSTSRPSANAGEKLGNSCEYCDSSTSKDSGIHSEIDSTSGASYSDTSMGRRLHYSTSNSGLKSITDRAVDINYDISSYARDIGMISNGECSNALEISPTTNTESTMPKGVSVNALTLA